jgi:hypothetical protein
MQVLLEIIKVCGSKKSSASCLLLGQCPQELELCLGLKVAGAGVRAIQLPGWQSFT